MGKALDPNSPELSRSELRVLAREARREGRRFAFTPADNAAVVKAVREGLASEKGRTRLTAARVRAELARLEQADDLIELKDEEQQRDAALDDMVARLAELEALARTQRQLLALPTAPDPDLVPIDEDARLQTDAIGHDDDLRGHLPPLPSEITGGADRGSELPD